MSGEPGFWAKPRPLGERMLILACFVIPVTAVLAYAIDGTGALVTALIVGPVLLACVWWRLRKIDTRQ